ncbi:MAG TPA: type II toxin-antitoxin system VapC family toxin [Accumulibacter sp.]|nr:type II toxin-antitoxin system VapC family toxin [Accumulibacter sp.]
MSYFMLDTNMASYVIKGNPPEVRKRLAALPINNIVISAITQAELLYGLARKGHPAAFGNLIKEFLLRVQVLPWDSNAATVYGDLRASCAASGITLGALDMLIAAHAVAEKAILVTHDKAFSLVPGGILTVEDWVDGA